MSQAAARGLLYGAVMEPDALITDEKSLLAATGADDVSYLADMLWEYVDGVTTGHDRGVTLQSGFLFEDMIYPFTIGEMLAVAAQLQEDEQPLQWPDTDQPAPPITPARAAKQAKAGFAPQAERLAQELLGDAFTVYKPQAMTTFARWFEDAAQTRILAVVAPTELPTVTDEVLAYGLAWQHDRELVLVLSDSHAPDVFRRLPWIGTRVSVIVLAADGTVRSVTPPSREQVLAELATLKARTVEPFCLDAKRAPWVERLVEHPSVTKTSAHGLANYVSWHHKGLQVLRVEHARGGGVRIQAGVQYSTQQPDHLLYNTVITGPISDEELDRVIAAVEGSVATGSLTTKQREHRLQASMSQHPPQELGLAHLSREYAGYRGPGRPGFIDFLGCDAEGNLHVVETKIGQDPKVVLQALDYGIWVQANEAAIRASRPRWPVASQPSGMRLDYVIAAKPGEAALSGYIAGQLEALADDITWRVFVVDDLEADVVTLTQVHDEQLWDKVPGLTAVPVRPRRS